MESGNRQQHNVIATHKPSQLSAPRESFNSNAQQSSASQNTFSTATVNAQGGNSLATRTEGGNFLAPPPSLVVNGRDQRSLSNPNSHRDLTRLSKIAQVLNEEERTSMKKLMEMGVRHGSEGRLQGAEVAANYETVDPQYKILNKLMQKYGDAVKKNSYEQIFQSVVQENVDFRNVKFENLKQEFAALLGLTLGRDEANDQQKMIDQQNQQTLISVEEIERRNQIYRQKQDILEKYDKMLWRIRDSHRVEINNLIAKFKGLLKDLVKLKIEEVRNQFSDESRNLMQQFYDMKTTIYKKDKKLKQVEDIMTFQEVQMQEFRIRKQIVQSQKDPNSKKNQIERKMKELTEDNLQLYADNEQLQSENKQLQQQLQTLTSEIQQVKDQANTQQSELLQQFDQKQQEIDALTARVSELELAVARQNTAEDFNSALDGGLNNNSARFRVFKGLSNQSGVFGDEAASGGSSPTKSGVQNRSVVAKGFNDSRILRDSQQRGGGSGGATGGRGDINNSRELSGTGFAKGDDLQDDSAIITPKNEKYPTPKFTANLAAQNSAKRSSGSAAGAGQGARANSSHQHQRRKGRHNSTQNGGEASLGEGAQHDGGKAFDQLLQNRQEKEAEIKRYKLLLKIRADENEALAAQVSAMREEIGALLSAGGGGRGGSAFSSINVDDLFKTNNFFKGIKTDLQSFKAKNLNDLILHPENYQPQAKLLKSAAQKMRAHARTQNSSPSGAQQHFQGAFAPPPPVDPFATMGSIAPSNQPFALTNRIHHQGSLSVMNPLPSQAPVYQAPPAEHFSQLSQSQYGAFGEFASSSNNNNIQQQQQIYSARETKSMMAVQRPGGQSARVHLQAQSQLSTRRHYQPPGFASGGSSLANTSRSTRVGATPSSNFDMAKLSEIVNPLQKHYYMQFNARKKHSPNFSMETQDFSNQCL